MKMHAIRTLVKLESSVFQAKKFMEFGKKRNFTENMIFDAENFEKQKIQGKKDKNRPKMGQKQIKQTLHVPQIWIKPLRSVYACFSWHIFTVYNCFVIWFVHVTEDHRIWSLEHRRTRNWHFRKWKTGGLLVKSLGKSVSYVGKWC